MKQTPDTPHKLDIFNLSVCALKKNFKSLNLFLPWKESVAKDTAGCCDKV